MADFRWVAPKGQAPQLGRGKLGGQNAGTGRGQIVAWIRELAAGAWQARGGPPGSGHFSAVELGLGFSS